MGSGNSKKKRGLSASTTSGGRDNSSGAVSPAQSSDAHSGGTNEGPEVILNVYNLQGGPQSRPRSINERIGLGVYHSGIEVFGSEYAFNGYTDSPLGVCGIFTSPAKHALPVQMLKESVVLGRLPPGTGWAEISAIINRMRPAWDARTYHLLQRNCNHFSHAFRDALAAAFPQVKLKRIPRYINRAARFGDVIIPSALSRQLMGGAMSPQVPPQQRGSQRAATAESGRGENGHAGSGDAASFPIPSTREAMEAMTVRELKTMMWVNGISWDGCIEKVDLIQAVEAHRRLQGEQQQQQKQEAAQKQAKSKSCVQK
ncbi:putative desumoylating isopeptidase 2 [Trypanosoma grayi]|uniref:putative desumoylating isopeptidase 2 n=1 Tax=Trypanosoma grayi TaxID=71804 RepID=UPI0004F40E59|nr:putative desumoylating isopeptidase 2 [Trypanosoma grayi]KEG13613.1 putative desumoylating isopeptidase 2 [Trypanosoma grayi]